MATNARIQLFEPNPLLFEKLQRMFGRDERIAVHNFGLGDEAKDGLLVVPFYKEWMFDGLGSFNRDRAANWLKTRISFYDDRLLRLREVRCPIIPLDELELVPFFIKLDIQGYEYQALHGAERTIKASEPVLLSESADARTIAYLGDLGYEFYTFHGGKFLPRVVGTLNTFFMTEAKANLVRTHIVASSGCE